MKYFLLKLLFLFFSFSVFAQSPFSVYLIGDAGEYASPGKALLILKEELLSNPNSAVVFLGDNVYPSGLKINDKVSAAHLESQLQILREYKGLAYFIPGNHDWQAQKRKGLQVLKNQEEYVNDFLKKNSEIANKSTTAFLPENGLPGPETILLNSKLRLIVIDTQWFLHFYKKNKVKTKANTKTIFYYKLDSLLNLAKQNKEQVIIAAHHPIFSNGQHSKNKQPLRFLINYTPFKLFGLMGLSRLFSQDLAQPAYKKMRMRMLDIFNKYDNIIYASGHEHNFQYFKKGSNYYLVSGAGSKLKRLRRKKNYDSVFQYDAKTGFIKVEYTPEGKHKTVIFRENEAPLMIDP